MKTSPLLVAFLLLGFVAAPARSAEALKTGGNFEVETHKDLAYHDGKDADEKQKLDLYLPKGHKDYPILFFVHGGSWRTGDRKLYEALGQVFAKNGVGLVAISYRLSPKVQHPEHIKDVARAFAWTHANIGKYGGRPDQIIASGHSAGGHLVALLATDETYLKEHKLKTANIKAVLALSGVYIVIPSRLFEAAFGKDEETVTNASPLKHVKEKCCPFCLIYAEKDFPLMDLMAEQMCGALKKHMCDACTVKIAERDHSSIIRRAAASEDDPTTQAMLEFIAKHSGLKLTAKEMK